MYKLYIETEANVIIKVYYSYATFIRQCYRTYTVFQQAMYWSESVTFYTDILAIKSKVMPIY